jgi:hypothetical protein
VVVGAGGVTMGVGVGVGVGDRRATVTVTGGGVVCWIVGCGCCWGMLTVDFN